MNKNPIAFFFGDFHSGTVNIVLHFTGFMLLGFGIGINNLTVITLATVVMESGHFYNTLRGRYREYALLAIPGQWLAWLIIIWLGSIISRLIMRV